MKILEYPRPSNTHAHTTTTTPPPLKQLRDHSPLLSTYIATLSSGPSE